MLRGQWRTRFCFESSVAAEQVKLVYWRALQREPTEAELNRAIGFVEQAIASVKERSAAEKLSAARRDALTDLCHVLFNTSEFLYID